MKTFVQALSAAEQVSTKNEKNAALSGMGPQDLQLVVEALNPYRVFNVKKWDRPATYAAHDPSNYDQFLSLLDKLHDRSVVGNLARYEVTRTLSHYTERTASYLGRVLLKDLDCGAQRNTFEKLYPNLDIPGFAVMLAGKLEDETDHDLTLPLQTEVKYDGNRLIAIVENGHVEYLSRSGKPSDYCDGLFDSELADMERVVGKPIIVDGEALGVTFQDTAMSKGKNNQAAKDNLRFLAFDWMLLSEWKAQRCPTIQILRSKSLEALIQTAGCKKVIKSGQKICQTFAEVKAYFNEQVKLGFEGLIIKDPNALYEWDRSKAWTKWKPVYTFDGTIVEVLEGQGRLKGTAGKVRLVGTDENGRKFDGKVGSGFDDKTRAWLWANRQKAVNLGWTVEFETQELTKSKGSDVWSMRFGVFIRIRTDKN